MQEAGEYLVGEHDFASASASQRRARAQYGADGGALARRVVFAGGSRPLSGTPADADDHGERVSRRMVRSMVGTLLEVGRGRRLA